MQQGEASMTLSGLGTDDAHCSNCLSNQLLYITEGFSRDLGVGTLVEKSPILEYSSTFD